MSDTLKWLWLTTKQGIAYVKIARLIEKYKTISNIYEQRTYDGVKGLTKNDIANLRDKSTEIAERVYNDVRDCGAKILTCDNKYYPKQLREIQPMPYVLYMKGNGINMEKMLGIGIVGTRRNTDYGGASTSKIAYELGKKGAIVISGMALGIDCIAMSAAIKAGAKTIGVLGCGIDAVYPEENRRLFEMVEQTGLIISEYPPRTPINKGNFPHRNRIIAGLSRGVLVAEASMRSGSFITAAFALKYGRDVFAVPQNIYEGAMPGTNYLIQDGAKLVTCANDILEEYEQEFPSIYAKKRNDNKNEIDIEIFTDRNKRKTRNAKKEKTEKESDIEKTEKSEINIDKLLEMATTEVQSSIIRLLEGKELYADEIMQQLDGEIGSINSALIIMETMGIVMKRMDNRYILNDRI